jgi:peroxiredoxin
MKVTENQQAPDFKTVDVFGRPVGISTFKGKKIYLSFYRNAGCPVCNLRYHQLEKEIPYFKANNVVYIAVYQSEKENMLNYLNSMYSDTSSIYPLMVANPENSLYKQYHVENSISKLLKALLFHGGLKDVNEGKKLFKTKVKDDSAKDLISAEFIIDENGQVIKSHYGTYSGEFIAVEEIKRIISKK